MLCAVVDETLVDLVRKYQDVLFDGDLRETFQGLPGQGAAGRVVRRYQHQELSAVGDLPADLLQIHLVAVLFLQRVAHRDRAQDLRDVDVVHPDRIRHQELIAFVQNGHQCVEDRLGEAHRDHDILGLVRDMVLPVQLLRNGFSQAHIAKVGSVEHLAPVQTCHRCLLDVFRRVEVRSSDLEVNDLLSRPLHRQGLLIHLANARKTDGAHFLRDKVSHVSISFLISGAFCRCLTL